MTDFVCPPRSVEAHMKMDNLRKVYSSSQPPDDTEDRRWLNDLVGEAWRQARLAAEKHQRTATVKVRHPAFSPQRQRMGADALRDEGFGIAKMNAGPALPMTSEMFEYQYQIFGWDRPKDPLSRFFDWLGGLL